MSRREDLAAEARPVLVVCKREIAHNHEVSDAINGDEEHEEGDECDDLFGPGEAVRRAPCALEQRPERARTAVAEKARRRKEKERVCEPEIDLARRAVR